MANPNCVVKSSQRTMAIVDMMASSSSLAIEQKAAEWRAESGFTVRVTSYKIGPRKNPIIMHKVTKYHAKGADK